MTGLLAGGCLVGHGARILLVEDDDALRSSLRVAMQGEGYEVQDLPDGGDLTSVVVSFRPDLAVVGVRLRSGPNGNELAHELRFDDDIPVLLLSAAASLEDRLTGFAAGADDYLVKPFSCAELLARIAALLRRSGRQFPPVIKTEDLVIDDRAHTVTRNGSTIELTRIEYDLLRVLAQRPGQVFSKPQLLAQVWGFDAFDRNLVEVHISALRRKLEAHGPRLIQTVRGVGYVIRS